MNPYYTDYSEYLQRLFGEGKVQKLSVNLGSTCPNRDGTKGVGGCIYCNNSSFSPGYTQEGADVSAQIEAGRRFFGRKYPQMRYLVYFQSFTNTYGDSGELLETFRQSAFASPDIVGIIIGTRPDSISDEQLEALAEINKYRRVIIEYGAETSHDATLRRINRNHSWAEVCDAVERTSGLGLSCGLHLIAGLPGERREDVMRTVEESVKLPIDTLKLHQMQVVKGTRLEQLYAAGAADLWEFTLEEYLELCVEIVSKVPRRIAIERFLSQSPPGMLIHPRWGLKNYEFTHKLLALSLIHI